MSSMPNKTVSSLALLASTSLAGAALALPDDARAQAAPGYNQARANMVAMQPTQMTEVVNRWSYLVGQDNLGFSQYAGFMLAYPGFPQQDRLQSRAEAALDNEATRPEDLVAFFDQFPPLSNGAKARYALALAAMQRPEARAMALEAWRGGEMSSPAEAYMQGMFGNQFGPEDHDARMNALLWQGEAEAASRQVMNTSPAYRQQALARLALLRGSTPQSAGVQVPPQAQTEPGYVFNLARYYRTGGSLPMAISTLANRPTFSGPAFNGEAFIGEALRIARSANAQPVVQIASKVDDLFAPGADISTMSYRLRDDYTSLMWLGGTEALWKLGDARSAAPLFYRYGAAAQTSQTRSKGFYWAGVAAAQAGAQAEATRYFELAADYPDRFYGQLALEKLGRQVPNLAMQPNAQPTEAERQAFYGSPLTAAVRTVARGAPWSTGIRFYRQIAENAQTPAQHVLVAELARETGRRDLAVNLHDYAARDDVRGFTAIGFPTLDVPPGTDWTMAHAIMRQESQFAGNAISHAGARGLMQLMPGTAREQAGKLGMGYDQAGLINSPSYNIRLGSAYFARMMDYYNGAYPLAIAAYNAGPGNVNKWLRANGDPRRGGISWTRWIEEIPIYETKNYVQRVIENAAVYEQLNPQRARYTNRPRTASAFLG